VAAFAIPVDPDGEVVPHDHPDLVGEALMLRGVDPQYHVVPDANRGCRRLSSALFKNDPKRQGYLSFNAAKCITDLGETGSAYMGDRGWIGVVCMPVEKFRTFDPATGAAERWKIGMVPLPDDTPPDPCHGAVWGKINDNRANAIRRQVQWVVELPNVVLDETQ